MSICGWNLRETPSADVIPKHVASCALESTIGYTREDVQ